MIALEDLVIGIADNFQVFINKAFVDGSGNRNEMDLFFQVLEYGIKPFELLWIFSKKIQLKPLPFPRFKIFYKQVELPVECRLLFCPELDLEFEFFGSFVSKINCMLILQV